MKQYTMNARPKVQSYIVDRLLPKIERTLRARQKRLPRWMPPWVLCHIRCFYGTRRQSRDQRTGHVTGRERAPAVYPIFTLALLGLISLPQGHARGWAGAFLWGVINICDQWIFDDVNVLVKLPLEHVAESGLPVSNWCPSVLVDDDRWWR